MSVTLIAAVASNGTIGIGNRLPWRLPAEMAYFTKMTLGKPVLMGRKTFESLNKPLKDRTNIILSRSMERAPDGCVLVRSVDDAVAMYGGREELMVAGGAEVYEQTMKVADRILLTEVGQPFDGDAYFPAIPERDWVCVSRTSGVQDERNTVPFTFCVYERVVSE